MARQTFQRNDAAQCCTIHALHILASIRSMWEPHCTCSMLYHWFAMCATVGAPSMSSESPADGTQSLHDTTRGSHRTFMQGLLLLQMLGLGHIVNLALVLLFYTTCQSEGIFRCVQIGSHCLHVRVLILQLARAVSMSGCLAQVEKGCPASCSRSKSNLLTGWRLVLSERSRKE